MQVAERLIWNTCLSKNLVTYAEHPNRRQHTPFKGLSTAPGKLSSYPSVRAQRGRRENEYVKFDDDFQSDDRNFSLDFLPAASGRVLKSLQILTDRFVDVVYDLFPAGTSRSVVETVTKGGALLVTLAFASSILTFLLNAGFVVLGLYVAAKVFKIDIGIIGGSRPSDSPNSTYRDDRSYDAPPRRSKPRGGRFKTDANQTVSDLSDVWFERKPRKQKGQ